MSTSTDNTQNDDLEEGTSGASGATGRFLHVAPKTHPFRGKLIEKVTEDTPGATKRIYTNKKGETKTVFEMPYSAVTGKLVGLYNRERDVDFGDGPQKVYSTIVVIMAKGEKLNIELEEKSRFWAPFCFALPNIDLSRAVRIETWDYDQKGSKDRKASLSVKQKAIEGKVPAGVEVKDGMYAVPWRWNKDNPGKLPPAEQFKHPKTGNVEWFFDKRDAFLREEVIPVIAERIQKAHDQDMADLEAAGATEPTPAPQPVKQVAAPVSATPAPVGYDPDDEGPPSFADVPAAGSNDEDDLPF